MAISLEKGNIYTAHMVRSGTSTRGDWEMVKVKDKTKEITIWQISGVKYGARKRQDGRWQDDVSMTAVLKKASTNSFDFDVDNIDDGELPWKMDDNPFGIPEEDQLPL